MAKMNLKQAYTRGGRTYGPGEVDVDDADAAKDLKQREEDFQQYLDEGGAPPAPVTPGSDDLPFNDPRLRRPTGKPVDREALVRAGRQAEAEASQEQKDAAAKDAAKRSDDEPDKPTRMAGTVQDQAGKRETTRGHKGD